MDRAPIVSMREVFLVELSDQLDAEEQLLRELPLMAARATSAELRDLLQEHYRATQRHVQRIESLFDRLEDRRRMALCHGMRGLIHEARERHGSWECGAALDAAMLGTAEHIEHYEMAAYRCACLYAMSIGDEDAARALQQTFDEECETERRVRALLERTLTGGPIGCESERTPTSLMPGVWVTETTGFASVPPRAASDLRPVLEQEMVVARGEDEEGSTSNSQFPTSKQPRE
jgi:ferritin-like metal-binding protein YciE